MISYWKYLVIFLLIWIKHCNGNHFNKWQFYHDLVKEFRLRDVYFFFDPMDLRREEAMQEVFNLMKNLPFNMVNVRLELNGVDFEKVKHVANKTMAYVVACELPLEQAQVNKH